MATNVTEKDKTLHEVIDFLQKEWDAANNVSDNPDEEVYDFYDGMTTAYEHVINYCRHLLGYSGSMPSEVPNQSEGREMSSQYKVCPLFWTDRGSDRRLVNMEALEELLNEGWQILRVDTMPPTELRDNAVAATNVYILEREANDD